MKKEQNWAGRWINGEAKMGRPKQKDLEDLFQLGRELGKREGEREYKHRIAEEIKNFLGLN